MRERILDMLASKGILIQSDATNYILSQSAPLQYLENLLQDFDEIPLILTIQDVVRDNKIIQNDEGLISEMYLKKNIDIEDAGVQSVSSATNLKVDAKISNIEILKDITGNSTCQGTINDFTKYFSNRFNVIKKMLMSRRELLSVMGIKKAQHVIGEVKVIGIVNSVRTSKNGHKILEIEDEHDSISVLLLKNSDVISDQIVNDEVIGVIGKTTRKGGLIVASEIVRPDVPVNKKVIRSSSQNRAVFISDIHVGSNAFLEREWNEFIKWLNKDKIAKRIKFMVISGDLVDGIGIYPGQEKELVITDIYAQYKELARLMQDIPEYIEIVMMPGNHDAVRPAEPQPTFPDGIKEMFDSNIHFVGNPCYFTLDGVKVLAYHGMSIYDYIGAIQKLTFENPIETMKEMLKRRHLAPIYGGKTPIAPENEDYLVIDSVPDIFVTGHVHSIGVEKYKRTLLINASAWQSQTPYQKMRNFHPKPAKAVIVDLSNGKHQIKDFLT